MNSNQWNHFFEVLEKLDCKIHRPPGFAKGEWHLAEFLIAMDKGENPPLKTMQFLYKAFEGIRNGINPKKALGLQRKGRPPPKAIELIEREQIAYVVIRLDEKFPGKGKKLASRIFKKSPERIEQIYKEHEESAKIKFGLNKCLEKANRFLEMLDEDTREILGHWSPGYIAEVADIWESIPGLTPDEAIMRYYEMTHKPEKQ